MTTQRKATFTLSLDCEGLWGMADQASVINSKIIGDASLKEVYALIEQTLAANQVKATCAFVSVFAAGSEAVRSELPLLRKLAGLDPNWFVNVLAALEDRRTDGWFGENYYQAMREGGHEMAWHGTTHLSLADRTSAEAVELELELARRMFDVLGNMPQTIVFPRNVVGHLKELRRFGFKTYRSAPPAGLVGRASSLAQEWNVCDRRVSAKPSIQEGLCVSPAGFFLNWPSGARSLVTPSMTVSRWKSLLHAAVDQGGYVHMWFHPHNLITAPAMRQAFTAVMKEVGNLVRAGDLLSLTMADANNFYGLDGKGAVR